MDEETLTRVLTRVLDERNRIDAETHSTHHEYVKRCIRRDELKQQRIERIKTHVIGWGVVAAIGGGVTALGAAAQEWLRSLVGLKGGP